MKLDKHQIGIITEDVNKASLLLDDLRLELIDHICCEVEELMKGGLSFEEAYSRIKQMVSVKVLKSVEDQTIQQIDINYKRMKNLMRISGNLALILLTAGTMMKMIDIKGGAIVLTIAFAILCLIFIPIALFTHRPEASGRKNLELRTAFFLASVLLPIGILFHIMQWPGTNILLAISFTVFLAGVMPLTWVWMNEKYADKKERRLFKFGIIAGSIFIASIAFKMFHLPAAGILMAIGAVLLVSIFLPLYAINEFRKHQAITSQFIYVIISSMYVISMVILMSFKTSPAIQ